ncbi:MAG: protease pro-enzyme activation domain-containing protein, partial [Thermoplasmata archaeon]
MDNDRLYSVHKNRFFKGIYDKKSTCGLYVITLLLMFFLISSNFFSINSSASSNRTTLVNIPNSYNPSILVGAKQIGYVNPNTPIFVSIVLKYRNENKLNQFLADLQNPDSPLFEHYLTSQEFIQNYSPSITTYNSLVSYLKSNGISIQHTWPDRVSISVLSNASSIERVFNVKIGLFETNNPNLHHIFYAPLGQMSLPKEYAYYIKGIDGASNATIYHTDISSIKKANNPFFKANGDVPYVYASDLQKAYDVIELYNNSAIASPSTTHIFANGRTIATILWEGKNSAGQEVAPFNPVNVTQYYKKTLPLWEQQAGGLSHVWGWGDTGTVPPGYSAVNDTTGANFENTLDLEMAGELAPGASVVNIYAPSSQTGFPDNEYNMALTLNNLTVVSNSWGGTETTDATLNSDIQQLNARGVTVLASSGDNGNTPKQSWPADIAYNTYGVIAVGGLTIGLNGKPSIDGTGTNTINPLSYQTVWYDNGNTSGVGKNKYHWGTTSGVSSVYSIPTWQNIKAVINNGGSSTYRNIADVSAIANNTLIYLASKPNTGNYNGYFWSIGGTSVACPTTAGIIAEIDSYLGIGAYKEQSGLGFLDPLIYQLGPNNTKYSSPPFYDVTTNPVNYHNPAKVGWDFGSGWGSINAWNFTMALKFWMSANPNQITVVAGNSAQSTIYVNYPTLYNSSVYLTVAGVPSGITYSFSQNIVDPTPNNKSAGVSTLSIFTSTTTTPGTYTLDVIGTNYNKQSNTYGNLTNLTPIIINVKAPLSVSVSPNSGSIDQGQSITLTATVSGGTSPYTYQWYEEAPGSTTYTAITGATSSSYTFTTNTAGTYKLYLNVTDSSNTPYTAQSNIVTITVNTLPSV